MEEEKLSTHQQRGAAQRLAPEAAPRPTKSHNDIYVVTAHNAPNVMREIGRLREIAFRAAGGGTGKSRRYRRDLHVGQLHSSSIVMEPEAEEIIRLPLSLRTQLAAHARRPARVGHQPHVPLSPTASSRSTCPTPWSWADRLSRSTARTCARTPRASSPSTTFGMVSALTHPPAELAGTPRQLAESSQAPT